MQYTIEARELTTVYTQRPSSERRPDRTTVEASGPDDALKQFVTSNRSELVSHTRPLNGRESVATVKKNDAVYLLRIYAN